MKPFKKSLLVALWLTLSGCTGPKIHIRHLDLHTQQAQVFVDKTLLVEVNQGSEAEAEVTTGLHWVEICAPSTNGRVLFEGWIHVEEDVQLQLTPTLIPNTLSVDDEAEPSVVAESTTSCSPSERK